MSEGKFAEFISPYHLLYGRDVNRENSDMNHLIELSEAGDVRKQLKNLQQILGYINKRFCNEYIPPFREQYDCYSHPHLQNVSAGTIERCQFTSSSLEKGLITEIIKGDDVLVRGASLDTFVSTTIKTQCNNRPLQYILRLKLRDTQKFNKNFQSLDNSNSEPAI